MLGSTHGRRVLFLRGFFALSCCGVACCSDSDTDPELNQTETTDPASVPDFPALPSGAPVTLAHNDIVSRTEVPLEADGGTFVIPVTINNTISLKFTIDSGASYVTIPSDVASTLVRSGTISAEDYVGSDTFTLADGSEVPSPEFRIRSLRVGSVDLHNVIASITSANGSLLLGQTFLNRLKSWSIDNNRHLLRLETTSYAGPAGSPNAAPTLRTPQAPSIDPTPVSANSPANSLAASSEDVVRKYFAAWSDPTDPDGEGAQAYYGDPVSFYGKVISQAELMSGEKLRFARRWPVRAYTVRPDSMRSRCSLDANICTVIGVVDWSVSSPATSRHSSGTARFSMTLNKGLIVGEGGKVLSRDAVR